jgi:hypothetical protein
MRKHIVFAVLISFFLGISGAFAQNLAVDPQLVKASSKESFFKNDSTQPIMVRAEGGLVFGGSSVSSSPISNIGLSTKTGFGVRLIAGPSGQPYEFTLGYSQHGHDLDLAGTGLGDMNSNTLSATARYRFDLENFHPYVGLGLHSTSFGGMSNGRGNTKTSSFSGSGLVAEVGIVIPIYKRFYADLNVRQYFMNGNTDITTGPSNALISNVQVKNPTEFGISAGYKF